MKAIKQEIFILTSQPQQGLGGIGKQEFGRNHTALTMMAMALYHQGGREHVKTESYLMLPIVIEKLLELGGMRKGMEQETGEDILSARDCIGHGTMVASIVAGSSVQDVDHIVIRGVASRARLAIYKVTWGEFADVHVILAAIDDCIKDGVDIINISMGIYDKLDPKYGISIATLNVVVKGISIVSCAGNEDKFHRQIMNIAHWVITVAAATKSSSSSSNNRSLVVVNQPHGGSLRPGHGFKGLHTDPKIPSSPTAAAESKGRSPRVPPKVAWFSLRGPSRLFPAVLKLVFYMVVACA